MYEARAITQGIHNNRKVKHFELWILIGARWHFVKRQIVPARVADKNLATWAEKRHYPYPLYNIPTSANYY